MELTDEALIESFRQTGDSGSFTALVKRYQDRLYNMAIRLLDSEEEAEEVVQETFLRVHESVGNFRRDTAFAGWLFRIAHNACLDFLRLRQRDSEAVVFDPQAVSESDGYTTPPVKKSVISQLADKAAGPDEELRLSEEAELIAASLKLLPDEQRIAVVLRDVEGFTYDEIASIVGASLGTVRSRIHYGRTKLRELLKPHLFPDVSLSR